MKKKIALSLVVLVITVGAIQPLTQQAKRINDMVQHTSIVSANDSDCSGIDTIISLYYHDKALQSHYDNHDIKVYIYHELDSNNFSHNEIEVNFTHYSLRYDL